MSRSIIFVLMYHRHKVLDFINAVQDSKRNMKNSRKQISVERRNKSEPESLSQFSDGIL
jgi:hypothetical protein